MPVGPLRFKRDAVVDGRFRIVRQLGNGGTAEVWLVHHVGLGRDLALKALHPHTHAKEHHRNRFRREARAAGRLQHPGIVQPMDFGTLEDGRDYLVLEYVEGKTLQDLLVAQAQLPWETVVRVATQLVDALAYIHARGLYHRDLKPDNLMLEGGDPMRGRARILDLGLARFELRQSWDMQTDPNLLLGSLAYAAPEQLRGRPVDARTDLYSLGAVMYRALGAGSANPGRSLEQVLNALIHTEVTALSSVCPDPTRPESLETLVESMLRRDPDERPPSAAEVSAALHRINIRDTKRPRGRRASVSRSSAPPGGGATLLVRAKRALPIRGGWGPSFMAGGATLGAGAALGAFLMWLLSG